MPPAISTSAGAREHLIQALKADLVGPFFPGSDGARERLPLAPSRWYLCGFLAPMEGRTPPPDANETQAAELAGGDDDPSTGEPEEAEPKARGYWPASMGLSVFLPAGKATDLLKVTVSYADYVAEGDDEADGAGATESAAESPKRRKRSKVRWRRVPREPVELEVMLDEKKLAAGTEVPGSRGVRVQGHIEAAPTVGPGVRAVAVFLVNGRQPGAPRREDQEFIFQAELSVEFTHGLVAKANRIHEDSKDWDERVSDLQFRDAVSYAVGHGVAAEPVREGDRVIGARTTWIPRATVRRVKTNELAGLMVGMDDLGALADGAAAKRALLPMVEQYETWIAGEREHKVTGKARQETAAELAKQARVAAARIRAGIDLLAADADVLHAFRLANQAMARAARQRSPERYADGSAPTWRLFQLAFFLMSLAGVADDEHGDREVVDLIFFPTGGGKTEAYLGVIAFGLVLRRMRGQQREDKGLGVAVILRYTLRLLTLDQLGRAATLMCALELLRKADPARLGDVRFSLGLWVGRSATANTMKVVKEQIIAYRNATGPSAGSPFPLPACPWCRSELNKDSLMPASDGVVVGCSQFRCDFAPARNPEGLPVLFVDEHIYRELPSFIIATVDKFAMLPWRGETGALFGRVHSRVGGRFFGPLDGERPDPKSEPLRDGLRPPELIVQDELHLIAGPLGTLVGLFETAVEGLCLREGKQGRVSRPKILASTATIRRARRQIRALYGRSEAAVFPPPGIDDQASFFASYDDDGPGREYVGIAAPGRSMKATLIRAYTTLLGAAQHARSQSADAADPYMTVVGYFNSLRELGGMRRLAEDEVRNRSASLTERRPDDPAASNPWLASRDLASDPIELTSRESTTKIARAKDRLGKRHGEKGSVDIALASNMISVGVDIDWLGLMVVGGQPKTTNEYIQATSRVGRDAARPGLVVTVYNTHKPRDRSHYERFPEYHSCFYRFVESASVTPFSGPALDRGLAGALVALVRLANPALTAPDAVTAIEEQGAMAAKAIEILAARARSQPAPPGTDARYVEGLAAWVETQARSLLDSWKVIARNTAEGAGERVYSKYDEGCRSRKALLFTITEPTRPAPGTDDARFAAPTSMRDVEGTVHLWVARGYLSRGRADGR